MARKVSDKKIIKMRSIEDRELAQIYEYQNGACKEEIADLIDHEPVWAAMTLEQVKTKIAEMIKRDRTTLSALYSQERKFVGLAFFTSNWDTRSPHIHVLIWPKYRRKGYGKAAAIHMLDNAFGKGPAHTVGGFTADWNVAGIALAHALGFNKTGVMRRLEIRDGKFYDGIFFGILRSEYYKKRGDGL